MLPFWADDDHTRLDCAARLYTQEVWNGYTKETVEKVELFRKDGIHRYIFQNDMLLPDTVAGEYETYFTGPGPDGPDTGYNWERIPLIPFKYNKQELPLIQRVKCLQDAINTLLSDFTNNMQEDARNTILILRNYDGEDLGKFRENLSAYGAVKVRDDGGVEKLTVEVNSDNYKAILDLLKKALIENAKSYDAKDDRLSGNPNQMNIRGNALRVVITASESSTEQTPLYDVETFLDTQKVETQEGISTAAELADNDFIVWKDDAVLALTASTPLTGGTNGTVEDGNYQTFLDAVESRTFNALGCTSANDTIKKLFAAFTERMRNDVGKKFQCIGFRYLADDEGVISLKNTVTDEGADPAALIPWVVGVAAGTAVNKSATNMVYDGEYTPDTRYTQTQLEAGIQEGSFMLHDVDGETRVLSDINTFVSITDEKGADFSSNQTIRVLDQIANDIAVLFGTKYLGKVPNDGAGRISLWNDIVSHHQKLQAIRALEDFDPEGITVEKGESKKSVVVSDHVTPVNAMEQLYMTVYVN